MIWFLYNIVFAIGYLLMVPGYLLRMKRRGGYRAHFQNRFGKYDQGQLSGRSDGDSIWLHAVSVGEMLVALRFAEEWRSREPDVKFVLSTNTSTGFALAEERKHTLDALIYYPTDFPVYVSRALAAVKPRALILTENEIWPNMVRQASKKNIPIFLINGRISDRSFRGYSRIRFLYRRLLTLLSACYVQHEDDGKRLVMLGAPQERVNTVGSVKYDNAAMERLVSDSVRSCLVAAGMTRKDRVIVGGSTWPGEENALVAAYVELRREFDDLKLVLVPRHMERGDAVMADVGKYPVRAARRSSYDGAEALDVLVVDTTGELGSFYAASDLVFVGKSLTEHGGQNPIEPAALGCAVVSGPNMENFRSVMNDLLRANAAMCVNSIAELQEVLGNLLRDPELRAGYGARARELVADKRGALTATVDGVRSTLGSVSD